MTFTDIVFQGANVWLNAEDDWVPAVIKEVQGKDIKFLSEYGKVNCKELSFHYEN